MLIAASLIAASLIAASLIAASLSLRPATRTGISAACLRIWVFQRALALVLV